DAYQRESRARSATDASPFSAVVVQPLRADTLFNAVTAALGTYDAERQALLKLEQQNKPRAALRGPRFQFDALFGFDPSQPRDEVAASIPQVLLLMNSPQ